MPTLADLLNMGKQYARDAMPGGLLNPEVTPQTAMTLGGLLADFTPVVGDVKSAYDGIQSARQGDYLGAGLGALGALPMVPNLAGSIGRVSPEIIKAIGNDEPAVLASKVKGLLSSNLSRQRSLNQRISREDISDSDKLLLNGDLIKTEEGIKKLHGWLTELEPPINHANSF